MNTLYAQQVTSPTVSLNRFEIIQEWFIESLAGFGDRFFNDENHRNINLPIMREEQLNDSVLYFSVMSLKFLKRVVSVVGTFVDFAFMTAAFIVALFFKNKVVRDKSLMIIENDSEKDNFNSSHDLNKEKRYEASMTNTSPMERVGSAKFVIAKLFGDVFSFFSLKAFRRKSYFSSLSG